MRGGLKKHDEPTSPNKGVCLRYMMDRNRQMRGAFKIHDIYIDVYIYIYIYTYIYDDDDDDPGSPNEGGWRVAALC